MKIDFKLKSKIWFESVDGVFLSEGRIQLLEAINQTGSLNKAAKKMNLSYQKAWKLLNSINKSSTVQLIEIKKGGVDGGGTILTEEGKKMINLYHDLNKKTWQFLLNELTKINSK